MAGVGRVDGPEWGGLVLPGRSGTEKPAAATCLRLLYQLHGTALHVVVDVNVALRRRNAAMSR
jgi:hypothetical protein